MDFSHRCLGWESSPNLIWLFSIVSPFFKKSIPIVSLCTCGVVIKVYDPVSKELMSNRSSLLHTPFMGKSYLYFAHIISPSFLQLLIITCLRLFYYALVFTQVLNISDYMVLISNLYFFLSPPKTNIIFLVYK